MREQREQQQELGKTAKAFASLTNQPLEPGLKGDSTMTMQTEDAATGSAARDASGGAEWCYSTNGEYYVGSFDTREEALAEGTPLALEDAKPGATTVRVWTGAQIAFAPRIDASDIFDQLANEATDFAGDAAEDFLYAVPKDAARALSDALTATFTAWMHAHGQAPTFFGVVDEQTHDIPVPAEVVP